MLGNLLDIPTTEIPTLNIKKKEEPGRKLKYFNRIPNVNVFKKSIHGLSSKDPHDIQALDYEETQYDDNVLSNTRRVKEHSRYNFWPIASSTTLLGIRSRASLISTGALKRATGKQYLGTKTKLKCPNG